MKRWLKRGIFLCFAAALCVLAAGCKKRTGNAALLAVSVDEARVYLDEAMYYVWQMEKECVSYEKLFQKEQEGSFWEQDAGDGRTVRQAVKQDVMDNMVRTEILYAKALKEGYSLTDEEKEQCRRKADELLEELSEEQKKATGLTGTALTRVMEKDLLVSRYYSDITEGFQIDRKQAEAAINPEEYRELEVETLSIPTVEYLEGGAVKALGKEAKKRARRELEELLEAAGTAGSLREFVEDDQSALEYEEFGFQVGQDACDPAIEAAALTLTDGETSGIIETKESYVILRMVTSRSEEGYEDAVDSFIREKKYRSFDEFYDTLRKESHIAINDAVWDKVEIGKVTIKEE